MCRNNPSRSRTKNSRKHHKTAPVRNRSGAQTKSTNATLKQTNPLQRPILTSPTQKAPPAFKRHCCTQTTKALSAQARRTNTKQMLTVNEFPEQISVAPAESIIDVSLVRSVLPAYRYQRLQATKRRDSPARRHNQTKHATDQ